MSENMKETEVLLPENGEAAATKQPKKKKKQRSGALGRFIRRTLLVLFTLVILVASGLVMILDLCFKDLQVSYAYAIVYGILGSAGAVFGDLCFSVIKRQTGIKDYGNLIPGHGGILDRFDSMMIVGPLAEALILLIPVAVKVW